MTTYDLGDGVPLEHEVHDPATDALVNATVSLTLTRPDGTTFPAPTITNPSTGIYRATPVPDQVGANWAGVWTTSGTVISVKPFSFSVADPAPADYTTLPTVKAALGKLTADDRDDLISAAISAASRWIDRRCGRYFYADRTPSTRTFRGSGSTVFVDLDEILLVDDIASATGVTVAVGTTTYTPVSSFDLGPFNSPVWGRPYNEIRAAAGWLVGYQLVQVTAKWGWPAVPDEISQAAALLAARLYRRKDSPAGVFGNADTGLARISRTDADVEALIAPYINPVMA